MKSTLIPYARCSECRQDGVACYVPVRTLRAHYRAHRRPGKDGTPRRCAGSGKPVPICSKPVPVLFGDPVPCHLATDHKDGCLA